MKKLSTFLGILVVAGALGSSAINYLLSDPVRNMGGLDLLNKVIGLGLKEVLPRLGFTASNYKGLAYVNTDKSEARAGLKFFNTKLNEDVVVEVAMSNVSGHWQIMRFSNLPELTGKIIGTF
jgi:hypothetical protein